MLSYTFTFLISLWFSAVSCYTLSFSFLPFSTTSLTTVSLYSVSLFTVSLSTPSQVTGVPATEVSSAGAIGFDWDTQRSHTKRPLSSYDSSRVAQQAFFNALRSLCGQSLTGKTQYLWNNDPNDPFVVNPLKAYVRTCSDTQIRIPFHIGNDTSRTWIFTMTPQGLQFKHQHLKPDGTPDRITNYGGMATANGTRWNQFFPADQQTVSLDTAYTTNQWNVVLDLKRGTLEYRLTRYQRPRYTAVFTRD